MDELSPRIPFLKRMLETIPVLGEGVA